MHHQSVDRDERAPARLTNMPRPSDAHSDARRDPLVIPLPTAPETIELRHLRSFVAVAEELNFGRAATRLYLSQPALSRQIRALERAIGCDLFRRTTHLVELTLAGEALLEHGRSVLTAVDGAVSRTREVGGELTGRADRLWEPVIGAAEEDDIHRMRVEFEQLHAQASVPEGVTVLPVTAGGVPALTVAPSGAPTEPAVLFVHGGGNALGSAFGYRALAGAIAMAAGAAVLIPDYRLAPEHPFPAGLSDIVAAYLWLLDNGAPPTTVTLVGDSSGGSLAVATMLLLRDQRLPLPGAAALLCPGLPLPPEPVDEPGGQSDAEQDAQVLRRFADYYLAGHPATDPLVNIADADLTGLPRMLIQAATGDALTAHAHLIAHRARAAGVDTELELYPVDTHVFHTFFNFLPEARDALDQVAELIGRHTRADTAGETG
jgi:epsilon-lactone hydrolase